MKICGRDGEELRCCKTGLTIHDANYHPDSRFQADMFYCPTCQSILIVRAYSEYFAEDLTPDLTITHDSAESMLWNESFINKMQTQYNLDILAQFQLN